MKEEIVSEVVQQMLPFLDTTEHSLYGRLVI